MNAIRYKRKKWKFVIAHTSQILIDNLVGHYEGESRDGKTCNLHWYSECRKFDTWRSSQKDWFPEWCLDDMFNDATPKIYEYRGVEWRYRKIRCRTFGCWNKIEISGMLMYMPPGTDMFRPF